MRKLMFFGLLVLMVAALVSGPGAARPATAQRDRSQPAHLVLSVENGSDAQLNRMDWDVNAWSPLLPGASLRPSDYIELSGRTTTVVLCTDLQLLDQRGSESPACSAYPANTFFAYVDDPTWTGPDDPSRVTVLDTNPDTFPAEVRDPGSFTVTALEGDALTQANNAADTIRGLGLSADAQAFALSSLYRAQGLTIDALGQLTALPNLGCTERRAFVDPPSGDQRPLVQSPVLYLRTGELYQTLGQDADAQRNYQCAADLAQALNDPADFALASARLANLAQAADATAFYQAAIDNYAKLGAKDAANALLDLCGLRSCTLPQ